MKICPVLMAGHYANQLRTPGQRVKEAVECLGKDCAWWYSEDGHDITDQGGCAVCTFLFRPDLDG
jgi:hypothetical protein